MTRCLLDIWRAKMFSYLQIHFSQRRPTKYKLIVQRCRDNRPSQGANLIMSSRCCFSLSSYWMVSGLPMFKTTKEIIEEDNLAMLSLDGWQSLLRHRASIRSTLPQRGIVSEPARLLGDHRSQRTSILHQIYCLIIRGCPKKWAKNIDFFSVSRWKCFGLCQLLGGAIAIWSAISIDFRAAAATKKANFGSRGRAKSLVAKSRGL